jgi:transcriptional regulator with XRE-family HTH domain
MALPGFSDRLRAARDRLGLTREQVATRLRCNVSTLKRWENGDYEPSIATLARLADLYGVTANYLIHGTKNGNAA